MTEARPKNYFPLLCLVLALGTTALYWPITGHPFILYDDEEYVTGNTHVTTGLSWANFRWAFDGAHAANWHPLTWISHQADASLFGVNAGGHHFINLLFHVANTLLVFIFLRGASGAVWRSALVAALFAWHPLHVESVAWASERKDMLSTFFWLLTLLAYVRYVQRRSWLAYAVALIFFALGLMSKPMVVTLPFVLLLLDWWPLDRFQVSSFRFQILKRLVLEKIPFFVLAAAGSATTYLVQSDAGAVWAEPIHERLANAVIAYARYVAKIFWPSDLAIVYSHPKHWPALLALGSLLALLVWTFLSVRNWRTQPYLTVGWFWFLGTLVPTIGLVQVGAQAMADRYTYIPSIGFFILVVWGGSEFFLARPAWKNISRVLAVAALLACWLVASMQISLWRDNVTLFRHALEVSPDNYIAANCLGKGYEKIGDNPHALVLYRAAVEAEPRFPQSQFNYAMMLLSFGDKPAALQHLEAAAALEPRNPDIQYDLGQLFAREGDWLDARNCFSNSVAMRPDSAPGQFNFGAALLNLGDPTNAVMHFREALRLQPDFGEAKRELERLEARPLPH